MAKKKPLFHLFFIYSTSCTLPERGKLRSDLRVTKSTRRLLQTNSFWWRKSKNERGVWGVHSLKGSLSDRKASTTHYQYVGFCINRAPREHKHAYISV